MEIIRGIFKKIQRTITSLFFPVASYRDGECRNCGACCHLPYECPFLERREDRSTFCSVYAMRPPQCRKYPRSPKEWETRDCCGYCFREK